MIWQDFVIMLSVFGLSFSLIPSILSKHKPAKSSCILSIILASLILICFATLHLWLSVSAEIASIITWGILLIQHERISIFRSS
jgi:hypothetical protein